MEKESSASWPCVRPHPDGSCSPKQALHHNHHLKPTQRVSQQLLPTHSPFPQFQGTKRKYTTSGQLQWPCIDKELSPIGFALPIL